MVNVVLVFCVGIGVVFAGVSITKGVVGVGVGVFIIEGIAEGIVVGELGTCWYWRWSLCWCWNWC